uniref:Myomegalin-like n=1 Tax=Pelodiscus sinensis TaxID=13735 RepID=K7F3T7_PELSI
MREICRICARELYGNQRRWIFHTATKLNLQVLLSHVLGKELCRDGKPEFACSKCAFMLDRIYRFDTVIARIEALSIERLQKLLQEKDRLKFCIASMYRRNNEDSGPEDRVGGDATVDISGLPDLRYTALLQEDFAYSGLECWTEHEEQSPEPPSWHASEGAGSRPRRCHGCAVLRVADADYEAICKVPRKVARSISCGPSTRWSASICNEDSSVCEPGAADLASAQVPVEEESMEEGTPGSSVESLDTTVEVSPPRQKDEEADQGVKGGGKWDVCSDGGTTPNSSLSGNRLELALRLIKAFDYKPVQSPRGSRLPILVKSILPCSTPSHHLRDGSALPGSVNVGSGFLSAAPKPFPLELSDLQELWDDLCEDYLPLRVQVENLLEDHEQPTQSDPVASGRVSELQGSIQQYEATTKLLQEKLDELNFELNSVQKASQRQERTIQSLSEALRSRERETEELYQVIDRQNEAMAKLQDTLQRSQLGHLQASEGPPPSQQQLALLDLQNTLFCTQLEVQKLQRAQRQKEHQLAEARRATQLLEADVQEEQQLKEVSWKHNQELRKSVQQAQAELQGQAQQLQALEGERCREIRAQEQRVQHLSQRLAHKEQLLQESRELLQHWQSAEKSPAGTGAMLEKLQQRIRDRDAALERGIDERFCALEEKERELQKLHLCVREREHDLQRLRDVLSSNEATMQSMESLLKAKALELEQASAACQTLQQLKEEVEAKSSCWQKEQEGIMQQLQTSLHDRNKDVEELTATLLRKLGPGQREVVEELCVRLQRKERLLQGLLCGEHEAELGELFRAMSAREQRSRVAAGKLVQALAEKSDEVQFLRRQLAGKSPAAEDKQPFQERLPGGGGDATATRIPMGEDSKDRAEKGLGDVAAELEKELASAREDLALMARKERESRVEVSALRSAVSAQEKELQVQASDIESLTRSVQSKEDLIKDLQMQLVDPEEVPAMERLTQEVLVLREKVATAGEQKAAADADAGGAGGGAERSERSSASREAAVQQSGEVPRAPGQP